MRILAHAIKAIMHMAVCRKSFSWFVCLALTPFCFNVNVHLCNTSKQRNSLSRWVVASRQYTKTKEPTTKSSKFFCRWYTATVTVRPLGALPRGLGAKAGSFSSPEGHLQAKRENTAMFSVVHSQFSCSALMHR